MIDEKKMKGKAGLTRRAFLATTAAVAGACALGGCAHESTSLAPKTQMTEAEERVCAVTHLSHCHGNCSLKVTVRDGKLALIEPNNWDGNTAETCCCKGISESQHVYGPERLQTPLRRTGERGSGEFEAIGWEEALDEVASRLASIRDEYGGGAILGTCCGEVLKTNNYALMFAHLGANQNIFRGIDTGLVNGHMQGISPDLSYFQTGAATASETNWVDCDLVVIWGGNPLESTLNSTSLFMDAKRGGTRFICVDPQFTRTAAKSDRWIPIRPGYDAELMFALCNRLMEEELFDRDYVLAHTDLAFLVNASTGERLREHAPSDEAMGFALAPGAGQVETGAENPFMVWDEAIGAPASYNASGVQPALEGSYKVDGESYVPAFALLKGAYAQYTPEWAAEQTGVDVASQRELLNELIQARVKYLGFGFGGQDKMANADVVGHAGVVLAALLGIPGGTSGGGFGQIDSYSLPLSVPLGSWQLPPEAIGQPAMPNPAAPDARDPENGIRAVFSAGDTLMMHFADMNRTREWLAGLDFVCVVDVYHSSGIDWADIVLPACSRFEGEEEFNDLRGQRSRLLLSESAIEPLFESHTDFWIEHQLMERLGVGDLMPQTFRELAEYRLATSPVPPVAAIKLEDIAASHGLIALPYTRQDTLFAKDYAFPTPSGRVECYYPDFVPEGQGFPQQYEPNEVFIDNPLRETYPLTFMQTRTQFHLHNHFTDATWLRMFLEPSVELNPLDLCERGIESGDVVEVFNDRGSFKVRCQENESIRPGSVRTYEGWWSKHLIEGNVQDVTNATRTTRGVLLPTGPIIPYFDTLVDVRKADETEKEQ